MFNQQQQQPVAAKKASPAQLRKAGASLSVSIQKETAALFKTTYKEYKAGTFRKIKLTSKAKNERDPAKRQKAIDLGLTRYATSDVKSSTMLKTLYESSHTANSKGIIEPVIYWPLFQLEGSQLALVDFIKEKFKSFKTNSLLIDEHAILIAAGIASEWAFKPSDVEIVDRKFELRNLSGEEATVYYVSDEAKFHEMIVDMVTGIKQILLQRNNVSEDQYNSHTGIPSWFITAYVDIVNGVDRGGLGQAANAEIRRILDATAVRTTKLAYYKDVTDPERVVEEKEKYITLLNIFDICNQLDILQFPANVAEKKTALDRGETNPNVDLVSPQQYAYPRSFRKPHEEEEILYDANGKRILAPRKVSNVDLSTKIKNTIEKYMAEVKTTKNGTHSTIDDLRANKKYIDFSAFPGDLKKASRTAGLKEVASGQNVMMISPLNQGRYEPIKGDLKTYGNFLAQHLGFKGAYTPQVRAALTELVMILSNEYGLNITINPASFHPLQTAVGNAFVHNIIGTAGLDTGSGGMNTYTTSKNTRVEFASPTAGRACTPDRFASPVTTGTRNFEARSTNDGYAQPQHIQHGAGSRHTSPTFAAGQGEY